MNAPRIIPRDLIARQIEASDPATSVWVAANAGSGKTHVLAQRVIRLLLAGVAPAQILCITFTKAAAANMSNRVFKELSRWTVLDDAALDAAIGALSSAPPSPALRARARRLFATALETPGGLKVQTIHAFCTRLLHQFPFEANVAARFTVMDEAAESQLFDQISLGVFLRAAAEPDSPLGRALATALIAASDQTLKDVINEAIRKRDLVTHWLEAAGGIDAAITALCGTLGITPQDTLAAVDRAIVEGPLLPQAEWPRAAAILHGGSKTDAKAGDTLLAALKLRDDAQRSAYLRVFFTDKDEPRKRLATSAIQKIDSAFCETLAAEQQRLVALLERRRGVACRDRSAALLLLAEAVITRYRAEKDRRGWLDYDDLITRTLALLDNVGAAWVHYKLDRGVDHVLIDEAQDTSPRQWEIVTRLTTEFFAGHGARTLHRTVFAVGDEKQSIFSFQGAAPRQFEEMRRFFLQAAQHAGRPFKRVNLEYSFRSGDTVLGAVDRVFAQAGLAASITSDAAGMPAHLALPDAVPGLVEIWDVIAPDKRDKPEAWTAAFDAVAEENPRMRLARRIAANVAHWMAEGARAGDVLVLVRQRGPLFESIIRALKEAHIPVAGADRLVLTEHIAVMDLMVLGDALLLPRDDLALATVLKSPLFGLTEDDLFALAWDRGEASLRDRLRMAADSDPRFAQAEARLACYAAWARHGTPFDFYARLLGPDGGRHRMLARLGAEASDALDEFLALALDHERREAPSLQGFLAWLRGMQTDVKRDMEMTRDEVRVMTVHGAKGLESRIVVLADTTTAAGGPANRQPRLLALTPPRAAPGAPQHLVWSAAKAHDVAAMAAARDTMRAETAHEHRRLLYVALTRAAERLVVAGAEGGNGRGAGCWYDLVHGALSGEAVTETAPDGEPVLRYRRGAAPAATAADPDARSGPALPLSEAKALPPWLTAPAPMPPPAATYLTPSAAGDAPRPATLPPGGGKTARRRGWLVHRLLQSLPDLPGTEQEAAGLAFLARNAPELDAAARRELLAAVHGVMAAPACAAAFGPGSRAEVPIAGRIERPGRSPLMIPGQIDRLAVTPQGVLILDYKTHQNPPERPAAMPRAILVQLALYRHMVRQVYAGQTVRVAVVWTETGVVMDVPPELLDSEFARLLATGS